MGHHHLHYTKNSYNLVIEVLQETNKCSQTGGLLLHKRYTKIRFTEPHETKFICSMQIAKIDIL